MDPGPGVCLPSGIRYRTMPLVRSGTDRVYNTQYNTKHKCMPNRRIAHTFEGVNQIWTPRKFRFFPAEHIY
jgi:hypothetical protein